MSDSGRGTPRHTRILVLDDNFLHRLHNEPLHKHTQGQMLTPQLTVVSEMVASVTQRPPTEEKKRDEKHGLLREWHGRMRTLVWMHRKSFEFYRGVALTIMLPTIMLSAVSGAINLIHSRNGENARDSIDIVVGVFSLTSAGLSALYHFLHLGERQSLHHETASQFEKLARQISVQTILTETDERTYVNLSEFIKECNEEFDALTDKMPHIPRFIVKHLMNKSPEDKEKELVYLQL